LPRVYFGAWSVVIRTVVIDTLIKQAIGEGVDTILNLGAGLAFLAMHGLLLLLKEKQQ
jgi:O-methyltransferase involved in polyketide biosynthesis